MGAKLGEIPGHLDEQTKQAVAALDKKINRRFDDIQFERTFEVDDVQPLKGPDPLSAADTLWPMLGQRRKLLGTEVATKPTESTSVPGRLGLGKIHQRRLAVERTLDRYEGSDVTFGGGIKDPDAAVKDTLRRTLTNFDSLLGTLERSSRSAVRTFPDYPLHFPDVPGGINNLDVYQWREMLMGRGVTVAALPDFPVKTPKELRNIVSGKADSSVGRVYPDEYLRGLLDKTIEAPPKTGSFLIFSRADRWPVLATEAGIIDPSATPVEEVEKIIAAHGPAVIEDLDFDPSETKTRMRLLRFDEVPLYNALLGNTEPIATSTKTTNGERLAWVNGDMKLLSANDTGIAPRVVIEVLS